MPRRIHLMFVALLCCCAVDLWSDGPAKVDPEKLPKGKKTKPGLYVTARQTYLLWRADQQGVVVLDVRTAAEYAFVGHPKMAYNVPFLFLTRQWDAARKRYRMVLNKNFVSQVKAICKPEQTVILLCRSGGRSAKAVNLLAGAGFKKVYTMVDGFEGDKVTDPASLYKGKRMLNGWKNAGLPWTYALDPKLAYKAD